MELRLLEYFLAIADQGNITAAAQALGITQPTLSRQIAQLEKEIGKQLFHRSNKLIELTEEGRLLRQRASEILSIVNQTQDEIMTLGKDLTGPVTIGAAETRSVSKLARIAAQLGAQHPGVRFNLVSGDAQDLLNQLDRGSLDFAFIFGKYSKQRYEGLTFSGQDRLGILVKKTSPLAQQKSLTFQDLAKTPLLLSRQLLEQGALPQEENLKIAGTYNLLYNASLLVEEGLGVALGLDGIINLSGDSPLIFIPLENSIDFSLHLIWKKGRLLSQQAQLFVQEARTFLEAEEGA